MQTPGISPSLPPIGSSGTTAHGAAYSVGNAWKHVCIDRLELERASPTAALATARACVDLGALLPVDVEAELTVEGGPDASLPEVRTERMWVAHSYQNGRYLFEVHLPESTVVAAERLRLCLRPAETVCGQRPVHATVSAMTLELSPAASAPIDRPATPVARKVPADAQGLPCADLDPEC